MYQNRIHRTTPNRHPQFFVRRSEIEFDPRTAYVESVCAVLIESRFGPDSIFEALPVNNLSDRSELEPAVFYDFDDSVQNGLAPCFVLSPLGRAGYQVAEAAYRKAKQMGLVDARPNAHNSPAALTPNQGRGSP